MENTITGGTTKKDTPSDSISTKVDTSVTAECASDCDRVFHHVDMASVATNSSLNVSPYADDTVESMSILIEITTVAHPISTGCTGVDTVADPASTECTGGSDKSTR